MKQTYFSLQGKLIQTNQQVFSEPWETQLYVGKCGKVWTETHRVCGKVWTFSGTVSVYLQWDDNKDLVEISRVQFKEAEGAS